MNELQISTITLEPAKVEFNKEQVINELNGILAKYENLVFTEDNTADIRETLAELRKGRKTADDYRKGIKKQLTEPVKVFENEMKEITAMFDDVINPINEQLQEYKERRKEEKRQEVQAFIDEVVGEKQLEQKYASQLVVENEFLNKSASMNQTKESIEFKANNLLNEQKLEFANREMIESHVKLKNAEYDVNLSVVAYLSQLEFKGVEEVKKTIDNDVSMAITKREKEIIKEAEEIVREEQEKKAEIKQEEVIEIVEQKPTDINQIEEVFTENTPPSYPVKYAIFTSMKNHAMLKDFLESNGIEYVEEMELPF